MPPFKKNYQLLITNYHPSASSPQLEAFLQDLQSRLDYANSQHNGHAPQKDTDFFNSWIKRTTTELQSRGYTLSPDNTLQPPTK